MIPISVCLETLFTDLPVEERIARIAEAGIEVVEFWLPEGTWTGQDIQLQAKDAASLKRACQETGITINDFSFSAWDGTIGGSPVRAEDHAGYFRQIEKNIAFAKSLGCRMGIVLSGMSDPKLSGSQMRDNLTAALAQATKTAQADGITLILEPLNSLVDHAGYYLDRTETTIAIIREINSPNLKMLYDIYHMQIMEGNLIATIENNIDIIGHFHAAGVPGRGEIFDNEIDYPEILKRLAALDYQGCFGLEYFPQLSDHTESLRRIVDYLGGPHVRKPRCPH